MVLVLATAGSLALNVAFLYKRPMWALVAGVIYAVVLYKS